MGTRLGGRPSACALSALALLCSLGSACDELGNPPPDRGQTAWTRWTNGVDATETRTTTVPVTDARTLVASVPPQSLYHADRLARQHEVATLVTVRPTWGRFRVPPVVTLVTEMDLGGGHVIRRAWRVPAAAPEWNALFVVSTPPRRAASALVP